MIFLKIVSEDLEQIKRSAKHLLTCNLVTDVNIEESTKRAELINGELKYTHVYKMTAKTRSQYFPQIEEDIRNLCVENMPELYSLPIVHMDWEQMGKLNQRVEPSKNEIVYLRDKTTGTQ